MDEYEQTHASQPLPDRRRVLLFAGEALAATVAAAVVSTAVQWTVNRLPIERESNEPRAVAWLSVFVLSCAAIALLWKRWSRSATVAAWLLPAALTSTVQALKLFGTPFYLFGTNGDQLFRMQYLQRLTVSPSLADGNYADLPPFYPAGWFWLGGRFANVIGDPAWIAYKPFAILTIAVASSLSFALWSLVVSRRRAFGIATVVALAGTVVGPYEPYSWLAMVFIPPLAVLAWRLFNWCAHRTAPTGVLPTTVVVGVGASIAAATYTLVFGFTVLLVVALAVAAVIVHRRTTPAEGHASVGRLAQVATIRLVLIGLAALPITLLVWAPYLYSAMHLPTARNAAAQFFPVGMASLDTPMLRPSLTGVVCMTGLIWIVLAWKGNTVAQALGITVLACVVWQVMSTLALAADTTLLSARVAKVGAVVLWCACALATVDLTRRIKVGGRRTVQVLVSVLAVLVTVELAQTTPRGEQNLIAGAFASYDDHGRAAVPGTGPAPGRFNKRLIDAVADMSGETATGQRGPDEQLPAAGLPAVPRLPGQQGAVREPAGAVPGEKPRDRVLVRVRDGCRTRHQTELQPVHDAQRVHLPPRRRRGLPLQDRDNAVSQGKQDPDRHVLVQRLCFPGLRPPRDRPVHRHRSRGDLGATTRAGDRETLTPARFLVQTSVMPCAGSQ